MLTLWCLLVPVASMVLVGLVVRGALARGKALDEAAWLQVPFVGLAATVLVLQTQLHLNIPINRGVFALWSMAALFAGWWLLKGQVRASLRNAPALPAAVCVAVLAVQALGMARNGPGDYVGRSWSDQFNYVSMAEYFRYRGYELDTADIGQQAWLVRFGDCRILRIGQSVLHAYHGVLTRMDTRALFMPTILLSGPLLALALYAAARALKFERPQAALAALFGGLTPGVAMLAQESFLSHALGIPFLLLLPTLLYACNSQRGLAEFGTAFLCLGALTAIYTEFLGFELLLLVGFFALALLQPQRSIGHAFGFAALVAAPWLCNPLFARINSFLQLDSLSASGVLAHIYPWAYSDAAAGIVWFGDVDLDVPGQVFPPQLALVGQAIFACGAAGLVLLAAGAAVRWWRGGRLSADTPFQLALALLGLAAIPGLLVLRDQNHPYQFFKLLVTMSPLFALGVVALARILVQGLSLVPRVQWAAVLLWLPVTAGAAVAAAGTARIAWLSAEPERSFRCHQVVALHRDFRSLRRYLEATHGCDILYRPPLDYLGYTQVWTTYFARCHRIWLTNPYHNDGFDLRKAPALAGLLDLSALPREYLVLSPRDSAFLQPPVGLAASGVVWQSSSYFVWKYDGRPWASLIDIESANGAELTGDFFWLGSDSATLHLFATHGGAGRLEIVLDKGPCMDPAEKIHVQVDDGQGNVFVVETGAGPVAVPLPLRRGRNVVAVRILNKKYRAVEGDARVMLARLKLGSLQFEPGSSSSSWACIAHIDNPYQFEDAQRKTLWLGGGDTTLQVIAGADGTVRVELEVQAGPCLVQNETPRFHVVDQAGDVREIALPPGRQTLEVPVVKGMNAIRVRPANAPCDPPRNDPRSLVAQWTLGAVSWRPPPDAANPTPLSKD